MNTFTKSILTLSVFTLTLSCTEDETINSTIDQEVETEETTGETTTEDNNSTDSDNTNGNDDSNAETDIFVNGLPTTNQISPWDSTYFSTILSGNEFQADSEGTGAKNWTASRYNTEPIRNGSNIQELTFAHNEYLYQTCPSGDGVRRAEYRDRTNRNLTNYHLMEFDCDFLNVNTENKIIFAQMHNDDSGVGRPYLTAFIDEGKIYIERTNNASGSGSSKYQQSLKFINDNSYHLKFTSAQNDTSITATVTNNNTGDKIENTWSIPTTWQPFDGEFYFKFGSYMPNGGSTETTTRVKNLDID